MTNAFIPEDRRRALAAHRTLPLHAHGSALFADISGFTPLTEALARQFGQRRGAELLTQQLNQVYSALISAVEAANGSVIGFSGDAITCWFDDNEAQTPGNQDSSQDSSRNTRMAARAAVTCAIAMQRAMAHFAELTLAGGVQARLGLKTAIVTGAASRLLVGEPGIQLIDVLAGSTLDTLADAEHSAAAGRCRGRCPHLGCVGQDHARAGMAHQRSGQKAGSAGAARRRPRRALPPGRPVPSAVGRQREQAVGAGARLRTAAQRGRTLSRRVAARYCALSAVRRPGL